VNIDRSDKAMDNFSNMLGAASQLYNIGSTIVGAGKGAKADKAPISKTDTAPVLPKKKSMLMPQSDDLLTVPYKAPNINTMPSGYNGSVRSPKMKKGGRFCK
jgi:hypothetical protein